MYFSCESVVQGKRYKSARWCLAFLDSHNSSSYYSDLSPTTTELYVLRHKSSVNKLNLSNHDALYLSVSVPETF